jgi:L-alanine-DL-glutamate epimerase-like enolase superfamily enzyme
VLIREYASHPNVMRKEDPTWKFALGASPVTEGSILRIGDEAGNEGFGYASATPHMGAIPDTLEAELAYFKPHVIGQDADQIGAIGAALDRAMRGAPQAKAAIDCALHELLAKRLGVPLCQLFGGKLRDSVPILRILAIKSPDDMAAQARKLVDQGYRYLKIKVHGEVDLDVARVRAIRKMVGDDVHLTIDANQAYTTKNAIIAISRMADYNIDLVEQPVSADDFEGLALVTRTVPVKVGLSLLAFSTLLPLSLLIALRIVSVVLAVLAVVKLHASCSSLRSTPAPSSADNTSSMSLRRASIVGFAVPSRSR